MSFIVAALVSFLFLGTMTMYHAFLPHLPRIGQHTWIPTPFLKFCENDDDYMSLENGRKLAALLQDKKLEILRLEVERKDDQIKNLLDQLLHTNSKLMLYEDALHLPGVIEELESDSNWEEAEITLRCEEGVEKEVSRKKVWQKVLEDKPGLGSWSDVTAEDIAESIAEIYEISSDKSYPKDAERIPVEFLLSLRMHESVIIDEAHLTPYQVCVY